MEVKLKINSVSDKYIAYLRGFSELKNIFDNKENSRKHTRKYLGIVFSHNNLNYFIPFSSPKPNDYIIDASGNKQIRKSTIPIIRIITNDTISRKAELKGTLKISNMIPVPISEITPYNIATEKDIGYKNIVTKEYDFIKHNIGLIIKNATILYNQKTNESKYFVNQPKPNYIDSSVDFRFAEEKCKQYEQEVGEKILVNDY